MENFSTLNATLYILYKWNKGIYSVQPIANSVVCYIVKRMHVSHMMYNVDNIYKKNTAYYMQCIFYSYIFYLSIQPWGLSIILHLRSEYLLLVEDDFFFPGWPVSGAASPKNSRKFSTYQFKLYIFYLLDLFISSFAIHCLKNHSYAVFSGRWKWNCNFSPSFATPGGCLFGYMFPHNRCCIIAHLSSIGRMPCPSVLRPQQPGIRGVIWAR